MNHGTDDDLARGNVVLIIDEHAVFARAVARIARDAGLVPRVAANAAVATAALDTLPTLRAVIVAAEAFPIVEVVRQSCASLPVLGHCYAGVGVAGQSLLPAERNTGHEAVFRQRPRFTPTLA